MGDDERDDGVEILEDELLVDAEDAPAERGEHAVGPRVGTRAALVGGAVDLDGEPRLGACEVDAGVADDELATEGEAGLRAGEAAPEPLLGARGREAHATSALFEDASLVSRDETTSEHSDLREAGARPRRRRYDDRHRAGGMGASKESKRGVRDAGIAVAVVAACNALIAFFGDHHAFLGRLTTADRAALFARLMLGPFGAWPNAPPRDLVAALPVLIAVHLVAIVPLAIFVRRRSGLALFWGALAWVATGYFVSVAVWI